MSEDIILCVLRYMKWTMVVLGLGLGGAAGGLFYKAQQASQKLNITKIMPKTIQNTNDGEKTWPVNVSTIQSAVVPPNLDA